ncbi:hypothetical protein BDZ45DRAFT_754405 [Acephala macrosclerotiorum]|nr:hypothetical protein BDZ45DRAFT_754405 [Acephala macrosclerotiorum]
MKLTSTGTLFQLHFTAQKRLRIPWRIASQNWPRLYETFHNHLWDDEESYLKLAQHTLEQPLQINLNETGGEEFSALVTGFVNKLIFATGRLGPALRNDISLVNAYTWEGGRGWRGRDVISGDRWAAWSQSSGNASL